MDAPDVMMVLPIERSELAAHPMLRVNKAANLMAVSTAGNCIQVLANAAGMQLLGLQGPSPSTAAAVASLRTESVPSLGAGAGSGGPAAASAPAARSSAATVRPALKPERTRDFGSSL